MQELGNFKPSKDFLVCIDSDGCAMDTMNIKHKTCFGPEFVNVYGLSEHREKVQALWEDINLYTKTRGINRFQSLALALRTIHEKNICPLSHKFDVIEKWTKETTALSNDALKAEYEKTGDEQLGLAIEWSLAVNKAISALPDGKCAYKGVREALEHMSERADIVVVSSANSEALGREWAECELLEYLSVLAGQEAGTKAHIISTLSEIGKYDKKHILMVGDAMGDLRAAQENGVLFYPILAGKEEFSWKQLPGEAFGKFISESYDGEYQNARIGDFDENLK